jgi:Zn-dependent M28 family amino/carboxypeptidase
MTFDIKVSRERLKRVLNEICSLGPRWQGDEGERRVLGFLERFVTDALSVQLIKEDFGYLGFRPQKAELKILDSPDKYVVCQPLAYSASRAVEGELIYSYEEELSQTSLAGKVVITDALKSYEAYPKACEGGAVGFILGNNLPGNLVRVGMTNYERKLGSIPGLSVGGEDTRILRELAGHGRKVRLEVIASSGNKIGYNLRVQQKGRIDKPRILICSHYDSMWLGPHAFDNASGTAAIVELIGCFRNSPYNLEFLLCGAEELGFCGSGAYVERHPKECREIAAVVCLDGICSDLGPVEVGVSERIAAQIKQLARQNGFCVDRWSIPPRPNSDHISFEPLGLPVFWLTTMDPYYHTAADVPENISIEKLKNHTGFVGMVIMDLADRAQS